jgi:hypothetical protein
LVARAWIVAAPNAPREHETGDVRAMDLAAPELHPVGLGDALDARADALAHADALRAVARRIGARLARKVLGHPAVESE